MYQNIIKEAFPGSMIFQEYFLGVQKTLFSSGFTPENTLLANCVCRDELNKQMLISQTDYWGENFELGGLAGLPTSGVTGFGAYMAHVPDNGKLFIIHGSHIGVCSEGIIGMSHREGMKETSPTCGSLASFVGKLQNDSNYDPELDLLDPEQYWVENSLIENKEQILLAKIPLKKATELVLEVSSKKIIDTIHRINPKVEVAISGGIMINTDVGDPDFWHPYKNFIISEDLELSEF